MKINKKLILIFLLALFLRLYQLEIYPVGFHVDEAKVAWNAYSVLKTGHDDRGNGLSLYYNSFGDYRLTGIIYSAIPAILVFGKTIFAVRFTSSLIGSLTIFPIYNLTQVLLKSKRGKNSASYWAAFFLATSVWHISVSRATSEVVIGMFFALYGLYFFINGINLKSKRQFILSFIFFLISFLFYHSIRVLVPLFLFAILFAYYKEILKIFRPTLFTFLATCVLSFLLIFNSRGLGRFSQTSIFADRDIQQNVLSLQNQDFVERKSVSFFDSKKFIYTLSFVKEYFSYFNGEFLFGSNAFPLRYTTVNVGVLSFVEIILFVVGLLWSLKDKRHFLLLSLLLISPLVSALTTEDTPNLHRALFMAPFVIIFVAYASYNITIRFKNKAAILIILMAFFNIWFFWHSYTVHAKYAIAQFRSYGEQELSLYLDKVHKNYSKVIVNGDPDSPYPWMAFFNNYDPSKFNDVIVKRDKGDVFFENYVFTLKRCPSDDIVNKVTLQTMLLVDTGGMCGVQSKIKDGIRAKVVNEIKRPDGSVAFTIWETK